MDRREWNTKSGMPARSPAGPELVSQGLESVGTQVRTLHQGHRGQRNAPARVVVDEIMCFSEAEQGSRGGVLAGYGASARGVPADQLSMVL